MEDYSHEYEAQAHTEARPKGCDFGLLTTPRLKHFFEQRPFEELTVEQIRLRAPRTDVFIDVGAHHGIFNVVVGLANPAVRQYAFEAVPENVTLINANISKHALKNIVVHEVAASDRAGEALFNRTVGSDTGSFVPHPLVASTGKIPVKTVRIDDAVQVRPSERVIVKIDTDGHELAVLRGMQRILKEVEDLTLVVEFNPKCQKAGGNDPVELLRVLHGAGFELFMLDDIARTHYRITPDLFGRWDEYMEPHRYHNVLCVRPKRAMSVVFFSQLESLTGSERSMLELVRELSVERGALVTVVFPREGSLVEAVKKTGASVIIEPYHTWYSASHVGQEALNVWMRMSIPGVMSALKKLRQINPQVVISNTRFIPWGIMAAQFLNKPHIVFPREAQELADMGEWLTGQKSVNELFYDNAEIIACNSAEPALQFGNRPKCEVYKTHLYISKEDREQKAPNVFKHPKSFKLFFPGNIYPDKGQMDAVQAVDILVKNGADVELVFLGAPYEPFATQLKKEITQRGLTDQVRFAPFTDNPYPHFLQADCILVCTRGEAFGRVPAEAMVLNVPVIATDVLGLASLVSDGETALVYTPGDYKTLARHIQALIADPALAKKLVAGAAKRMQSFTPETYGGAIWKMLRRVKGHVAAPNRGFAELAQHWIMDALDELEQAKKRTHIEFDQLHVNAKYLLAENHRLRAEFSKLTQHAQNLARDRDDLAKQLVGFSQSIAAITSTKTWRVRSKVVANPAAKRVLQGLKRG